MPGRRLKYASEAEKHKAFRERKVAKFEVSEPPSDEFSETSDEISEPLDESEPSKNGEGDLDEHDDFVIVETGEEDNTQKGSILVPTSAVENFIREVSVGNQL
mgnify:CR=1 FL=1